MQVVYSGGTTTPSPSPRLQRKIGYSRPVMPGYMTHVQPQILVQRSHETLTEGDTTLRDSIPAMSKSVAILCLVLNIFLPGSGTLTAGLSVLCCSRVRPKGDTKRHCIYVSSGVALVQFLLAFLFLLGWIWSIMWGVAFLSISAKHWQQHEDENKNQHREGDRTSSKVHDSSKTTHSQSHQHHHHHHHHHHQHHHQQHSPNSRKSVDNTKQLQYSEFQHNKSGSSPSSSERRSQNARSDAKHNQSSEMPTGSASVNYQPIIVLQTAPEVVHSEAAEGQSSSAPYDTIMQARTRHMKMLQRKLSDNDLSPFVLTNQQLQAIVIHDLPVTSVNGTQSQHDEDLQGLPKP